MGVYYESRDCCERESAGFDGDDGGMIDDFDNDCCREKYSSRVNIRTGFVELPVWKSPGKKENWCEGDTVMDPNALKVKKNVC